MNRALIWKEWREQRPLFAIGVSSSLMFPLVAIAYFSAFAAGSSPQGLADVVFAVFAFGLWPLFAAAAGASTFANESADRTEGFLLSRPVRRGIVWGIKVGTAAVACVLVITVSYVAALAVRVWSGAPPAAEPALSALAVGAGDLQSVMLGPGFLALSFSAAVFLSTRVRQPLAAAFGGVFLGGLLIALAIVLWPRVELVAAFQAAWASMFVGAAVTSLLTVSRWSVSAGGSGGGVRRTLLMFGVVCLATAVAGFVPTLYATTIADLEVAVVHQVALSPAAESVVAVASAYPAAFGSLWRLPDAFTEGERTRPYRLSRRAVLHAFFSQDGQRVYYFSPTGPFGSGVDLRAVGIDGSDDHLVVESIGDPRLSAESLQRSLRRRDPDPAFSSDGNVVVLPNGLPWGPTVQGPVFIDLVGGEVRLLSSAEGEGASYIIDHRAAGLLALTGDRTFLFSIARFGDIPGQLHRALVEYDYDTNRAELRLVQDSGPDWDFGRPGELGPSTRLASRTLPMQLVYEDRAQPAELRRPAEVVFLDLDTGAMDVVERMECGWPSLRTSADGSAFAYLRFGGCSTGRYGNPIGVDSEIVVRTSRSADSWPAPDAKARRIRFSPSGTRASFEESVGSANWRTGIRFEDGTTRYFTATNLVEGGTIVGSTTSTWVDDDHVMFRFMFPGEDRDEHRGVIAIIDIHSGTMVRSFQIPRYERGFPR